MSDKHSLAVAEAEIRDEKHHPHVNYWYVFYALCVFTLLSVIADLVRNNSVLGSMLGPHGVKIVIAFAVLSIACCKALFVMLYFMHLKFEGKWKFVLLAPTIVLACAIPAALMPDIGSHYYDYQVPQLEQESEAVHNGQQAETEHGEAPAHH